MTRDELTEVENMAQAMVDAIFADAADTARHFQFLDVVEAKVCLRRAAANAADDFEGKV